MGDNFMNIRIQRHASVATGALASAIFICTPPGSAQATHPSQDVIGGQEQTTAHNVDQHVADGQRHGLPLETYAVVPGTRFLVRLEQDLNTKEIHQNQSFRVRTLEPLEAGSGIYLPSGVEILGHVSRVEPAGT